MPLFLDSQNTHQKIYWTHEIPTRKILDLRNTRKKKIYTQEIPTRKNFGPTKARWYDGTRPMRPTMASGPRNLAHSVLNNQQSFTKYLRQTLVFM